MTPKLKVNIDSDLDLNGHALLTTDLALKQISSTRFGIMNRAQSAYRGLQLESFTATKYLDFYDGGRIATLNQAAANVLLQSYDTAYRDCIELVGGMANIPRCGDVTLLSGKTVNYGSGTFQVPGAGSAIAGSLKYIALTDELCIYDWVDTAWKCVTLT